MKMGASGGFVFVMQSDDRLGCYESMFGVGVVLELPRTCIDAYHVQSFTSSPTPVVSFTTYAGGSLLLTGFLDSHRGAFMLYQTAHGSGSRMYFSLSRPLTRPLSLSLFLFLPLSFAFAFFMCIPTYMYLVYNRCVYLCLNVRKACRVLARSAWQSALLNFLSAPLLAAALSTAPSWGLQISTPSKVAYPNAETLLSLRSCLIGE